MVARFVCEWYHSFDGLFMNGYSQPAEYRFSHDSIELAQRAAQFLQLRTPAGPRFRVLDLCAGCGVVGLELAKILQTGFSGSAKRNLELEFDFLEVQSVYREFFAMNCNLAAPEATVRWLEMNYASVLSDRKIGEDFTAQYDLVVSNPPYFDRAQGSLPPSDFRARCRFFIDSNFDTMFEAIATVLKPGGSALVLVRDLRDHGVDRVASLNRILNPLGNWCELEPVRGTGLIHFQKTGLGFT